MAHYSVLGFFRLGVEPFEDLSFLVNYVFGGFPGETDDLWEPKNRVKIVL
jgi:hypothetical protein